MTDRERQARITGMMAVRVFNNVESPFYTDSEKIKAIYEVLGLPTHNGFTKDSFLKVLKWIFDKNYEVEK